MVKIIIILMLFLCSSISEAQVTPGTVFSKTLDGNGNKITSTVVGPDRALNVYCLGGTCSGGGGGSTYLDADGIANQTASAVHGQTYLYNGATWDRARGTIANGLLVDVSRVVGNVTVVQPTGTNLHIVCDSGCGGAASFNDNTAFTFGTTAINNMGAVVDDTATNTVAENSAGAPRMNTNRILYGMPTDNTGVALYPSASALNDAMANPTTTSIGSHLLGWDNNGAVWERIRTSGVNSDSLSSHAQGVLDVMAHGYMYNGTNWDRIRGTIANGLLTNVSNAFLLDATFTGRINTLGQKTMANSTPVVLSSDQSSIPVTNTNLDVALSTRLAESTFTGRFTAAVLDADAIANETSTAIRGKCYLYNGTTWDRCRGSIAGGMLVNISNTTLAVTQSGTWNIGTLTSITNTVTVQGTKTNNSAVPGTNNIGVLPCVATSVPATYTDGNQVGCIVDLSGNMHVVPGHNITATNIASFTAPGNTFTTISISGSASVSWQVTGTWTGTLEFEQSVDNVNWESMYVSRSSTGEVVTSTQTNGIFSTILGITGNIRVRASALSSGTASLHSTVSVLPRSVIVASPVTTISPKISTANNDGACPSGAANFTVAASNASRTWLAIWASPANTDDVYVKLGVTATSSDARIAPGQTINFTSGRIYTGQVDAIPASGTQAVCLMELN